MESGIFNNPFEDFNTENILKSDIFLLQSDYFQTSPDAHLKTIIIKRIVRHFLKLINSLPSLVR